MDLAGNLEQIQRRIRDACLRANRDPASVELMAVSKNHPASSVRSLASLGVQLFGENRVQEARFKIPDCPASLRWHLIGHLQTNKARDAVSTFQMRPLHTMLRTHGNWMELGRADEQKPAKEGTIEAWGGSSHGEVTMRPVRSAARAAR